MSRDKEINPFLIRIFEEEALPKRTQSDIKTICFDGARAANWQLGKFHCARAGRIYHRVDIINSDQVSSILFTHSGRHVALSSSIPNFYINEFISNDEFCMFIDGYSDTRFLPPSELERELSIPDIDWLGSQDKMMAYDLKYWKPDTVGQVLFNGWD